MPWASRSANWVDHDAFFGPRCSSRSSALLMAPSGGWTTSTIGRSNFGELEVALVVRGALTMMAPVP
ncbi:MAG: hypothetical protein R3A10_14720 [Caldilineaceae bacterium]